MQDTVAVQRALARDSLGRGTFDVLVIGGGIIGISTAWLAARCGLRVALVDKGDFASATSQASSKLVHGGLRYLAMGGVKLVRENHLERRALGDKLAPHLVRPLPFLVPLYQGGPYGPLAIGAGMMVYTALSRFGDGMGKVLSAAHARELVPALRPEHLRGAGLYYDHQMNDARVAVMVARAAAEAGAVLLNHTEVVALRIVDDHVAGAELRDALDGSEYGVDAQVVVNATGPWVDHLRRMESPKAEPSIRLSKGAHLVLRSHRQWRAALTVPLDDVRVSFVIPWEGHLLLGTTDEAYEGDPGQVRCTPADAEQILGEAGLAVDEDELRRQDIVYGFAGLRVLPEGDGDTKHARRETVISVGPRGLVSVAGGKWTTFRHIGMTVIKQIRHLLSDVDLDKTPMPLPGAARPEAVERVLRAGEPGLPEDVIVHLAGHYGTLSHELLSLAHREPGLLERIHPDGPDLWIQAVYARDREWACTVEDVLRRRTTVTVRGLDTDEVRKQVAELLN